VSDHRKAAGSLDGPPSKLESLLRLEISPDGLSCDLVVLSHPPPVTPFELPALVAYLKQHKLRSGIQPATIHAALERLNTFSRGEQPFTIAVGSLPEFGAELLIQPAVSLAVPGPNDLDRSQAFACAAVEACGSVAEGDLIAEVRVDDTLKPGQSVTGEPLLPIRAALSRLELGAGVHPTFDEQRLLIHAARQGMVLLHPPRIDVLPVETIQGPLRLNASSEPHLGHLLVIGRVSGTAPLEAAGHLFVTGTVDGAKLRAGGSIVLGGGLLGKHHGSAGCAGNFAARSAEQCEIEAHGNVFILTSASQCQISSGSRITLGGTLAGGRARAGLEISAKQLGSARGINTRVSLDPHSRHRSHRRQLRAEIKQVQKKWEQLDRASVRLRPRGPLQQESDREPPELAQIRAQQALVGKRLKQLVSEQERIERMAVDDARSGAVVAKEVLHTGVAIRITDAFLETVSSQGATRARLAEDGLTIQLEDLGDKSQ